MSHKPESIQVGRRDPAETAGGVPNPAWRCGRTRRPRRRRVGTSRLYLTRTALENKWRYNYYGSTVHDSPIKARDTFSISNRRRPSVRPRRGGGCIPATGGGSGVTLRPSMARHSGFLKKTRHVSFPKRLPAVRYRAGARITNESDDERHSFHARCIIPIVGLSARRTRPPPLRWSRLCL
ncbi:hypothetical protein EVAR_23675_1 [Eumeta japonica]|uniref:Uncharacterized protein n=1 Tax=Eumeta variegata TaxID=151549 RepID=A0A4C1VIQ3_EUMVA|nr:hypothetical protein EVAR_23675_1 [Eumeta japonica]